MFSGTIRQLRVSSYSGCDSVHKTFAINQHKVPALTRELLVIKGCWGRGSQFSFFEGVILGRLTTFDALISRPRESEEHALDLMGLREGASCVTRWG